MPSRRPLIIIACAGVLAGAAPQSAAAQTPAPTLASARPCVSAAVGHELTGTGWTPGGQVRVRGRYVLGAEEAEAFHETVRADDAGRIAFGAGVPDGEAITVTTVVTAEDLARTVAGAPAEQRIAGTRYRATFHGVFYRPWNTDGPATGRPGRVATIEAMGFIGPARLTDTLYAHYHRTGDTRWRTVRVGRLRGACGGLRARFREFPWRRPKRGTYTVRFDTSPVASDATWDSGGYARVRVR
jgi:hypothetical protein